MTPEADEASANAESWADQIDALRAERDHWQEQAAAHAGGKQVWEDACLKARWDAVEADKEVTRLREVLREARAEVLDAHGYLSAFVVQTTDPGTGTLAWLDRHDSHVARLVAALGVTPGETADPKEKADG